MVPIETYEIKFLFCFLSVSCINIGVKDNFARNKAYM